MVEMIVTRARAPSHHTDCIWREGRAAHSILGQLVICCSRIFKYFKQTQTGPFNVFRCVFMALEEEAKHYCELRVDRSALIPPGPQTNQKALIRGF